MTTRPRLIIAAHRRVQRHARMLRQRYVRHRSGFECGATCGIVVWPPSTGLTYNGRSWSPFPRQP